MAVDDAGELCENQDGAGYGDEARQPGFQLTRVRRQQRSDNAACKGQGKDEKQGHWQLEVVYEGILP